MTRRRRLKKQSFWRVALGKINNSRFMPILFAFAIIGSLYVLTRMKGIEQDYEYNEIAKRIEVQKIQNKELKAKKARMLSVKRLKTYAKKFKLQEPDEKHIIVIPSK